MGLRSTTSAPGKRHSVGDTATTVSFCHPLSFRALSRKSAEPSSQSTTTRSVPPESRSKALDELKQMLVEMDRSPSNLFMMQITPGSRETNKHSKAMSGVTPHLSYKGHSLVNRTYFVSRPQDRKL